MVVVIIIFRSIKGRETSTQHTTAEAPKCKCSEQQQQLTQKCGFSSFFFLNQYINFLNKWLHFMKTENYTDWSSNIWNMLNARWNIFLGSFFFKTTNSPPFSRNDSEWWFSIRQHLISRCNPHCTPAFNKYCRNKN